MVTIDEERITLTFAAGWNAMKWDSAEGLYRDGIERLKGELDGADESTKAVDVVASPAVSLLVLIEVKDFRSASTQDGARSLAAGGRWKALPLEIALKVRDTLAGLYGVVQRREAPEAEWISPALQCGARVLAIVPQDDARPRESNKKRAVRDDEMRKNLQRRLAWLTRDPHHVAVIDRLDGALPPWLQGVSLASR